MENKNRNKITNPFYIDVINALVRFDTDYRPSQEEILSEPIWLSSHTKFSKSIVRDWDKKRMRFMYDLFHPSSEHLLSKT